MLRATHDPHNSVLHRHMDKGVEAKHTERHQGRPNGTIAAEIQSQGRQDAHRRRHSLRTVLAAALRYFRSYQAWR